MGASLSVAPGSKMRISPLFSAASMMVMALARLVPNCASVRGRHFGLTLKDPFLGNLIEEKGIGGDREHLAQKAAVDFGRHPGRAAEDADIDAREGRGLDTLQRSHVSLIAIVVAGRDAGVLKLLDHIAREIVGCRAPNLTGGVEPNPVSERFSCFVLARVEGAGDKGKIDRPSPV